MGDSITDYTEFTEMLEISNPILNRGIGGDRTEGAVQRLLPITELHPHKIFILLGINDIDDGMELSKSMECYGEILNTIRRDSPDTEIFVQSVLPVNHSLMANGQKNRKSAEAICAYNQALEALSTEKGVAYIDVFSQMADEKGEMPEEFVYRDGLHLTRTGMETWINCLRPYLQ